MEKEEKIVDKLLPIRVDNTITIYHVKYKEKDIRKLIDKINAKYAIYDNVKLITPFMGNQPLNYGQFDKNPYVNVKSYEVLNYREKNNSNEVVMFPDLFFPKEGEGEIKASIEKLPALSIILEDTFLTSDNHRIIDMTDLIKYRNYIFDLSNNFVFDKTIDLPSVYSKKSLSYEDKIKKFFTINDYRQHLARLAHKLNDNTLFLNEKEEKKIRNDIYELVNDLQRTMEFEDIAMFPLEALNQYTKESETKKILTRFGDRNKDCNYQVYDTKWNGWFGYKLDLAKSNNDGAKVYNDLSKDVIFNYDIDGQRFEKKALKGVIYEEPSKQNLYTKKAV